MTDAAAGTWFEVPLRGDGLLTFDGRVVELFSRVSSAWRVPAVRARIDVSAPHRKGHRTIGIRSTYRGPGTSCEVMTEHEADLRRLTDALPEGTATWE